MLALSILLKYYVVKRKFVGRYLMLEISVTTIQHAMVMVLLVKTLCVLANKKKVLVSLIWSVTLHFIVRIINVSPLKKLEKFVDEQVKLVPKACIAIKSHQ